MKCPHCPDCHQPLTYTQNNGKRIYYCLHCQKRVEIEDAEWRDMIEA